MGQSSIHYLNKSGHSMFWCSMWDDKINYKNILKQDHFIRKFIDLFFDDCMSINTFKYNKKYNFPKNSYKFINKKDFFKYSVRNKPIIFNSKIWILRYQNWLLLYNYFYINKIKKFNYKNFYFFNNNLFKKYNNIFLNNYSFFKKQNKLKF